MAVRFVGGVRMGITFLDKKSRDRFWYRVSFSFDGSRKLHEYGSLPGGFGPGVAADSSEAYDRIAASAARFEHGDEDEIGFELSANVSRFGDVTVRRKKDGQGRVI